MISKHAEDSLAEIKPISKRIIMVFRKGNAKTTVLISYSPIEGSDDSEQLYETLANVNSISKHHMIVDCGDFNAHLGEEDVRYAYHERTNQNGKFLLNHAEECGLNTTNAMFLKKKGKLWTYLSDMNGRKIKVDLILLYMPTIMLKTPPFLLISRFLFSSN